MVINRCCFFLFIILYTGLSPASCFGGINVVKEVVITPKSVNAAANIGSVNSSVNVRMHLAKVDIFVGEPEKGAFAPLPLSVRATFGLVNESSDQLQLTVVFPISNSQFSSLKLHHVSVIADDVVREVIQRKSSYPRSLTHEYISAEIGPEKAVCPEDITPNSIKLFGDQLIGQEAFQNLMVWNEKKCGVTQLFLSSRTSNSKH